MLRVVGKVLLALVVVSLAAFGIAVLVADDAPEHPVWSQGRPLVIAHQGGDGLRPSNTLAAFDHAAGLGADVLEMDVHRSADGHLVLIHDATLDRTTDGTGPVADHTVEQLRQLDAGYRWPTLEGHPQTGTTPYRGRGLTIPTVAEVLRAHPDLPVNIEIKPTGEPTALALCDELRRLGAGPRALVASFHDDAMAAFREACPEIATSSTRGEILPFYVAARLQLEAGLSAPSQALQVPLQEGRFALVTPDVVDAAHDRGMAVHAWTINEEAQIREVLAAGVDGVITDYPDRVLELRDARVDP
ncbi:glycerophosphodiester phosphodiesterase [Serinicoccus kebangsaanensis]|uniref:glycerophosphodiester phosphodiesterase n=1 Tax=Serinicoccus kebangsaanensis TaxID=2602069 RepID=UPI00178C45E7|nr:glycerophosphodiester phosphodiesterase [Serinicoccus kebangsaanensis]